LEQAVANERETEMSDSAPDAQPGDEELAAGEESAAPTNVDMVSVRRIARITALIGMAYTVLFVLSTYLLAKIPRSDATDAEIISFYSSDSKRLPILAGLYVMPFAGIAFIWFIVFLRAWIRVDADRRNLMLSNVQLVSGILFVGIFFVAAAGMSVVAATTEFTDSNIDPEFARQFPGFSSTLLIVFGMRMAAMFVFTSSNLGLKSGVLPKWFVYLGFVFGLFLLLSASLDPLLVEIFPIWIFALCILMFWRSRAIPKELVLRRPRQEEMTPDEVAKLQSAKKSMGLKTGRSDQ
jgi:hypothetical protein